MNSLDCSSFLRTIDSTSCSNTSNLISELWSVGRKSDMIGFSSKLDKDDEEYLDSGIVCNFIKDHIEKGGFCGITIKLESEEMITSNLEHVFTFVVIDNKVNRIESYLDCYYPRMIETSNFYKEMLELLSSFYVNNKNFTDKWNKLFNVNESVPDEIIYNCLFVDILYLIDE